LARSIVHIGGINHWHNFPKIAGLNLYLLRGDKHTGRAFSGNDQSLSACALSIIVGTKLSSRGGAKNSPLHNFELSLKGSSG
jgi:hypothetical protein